MNSNVENRIIHPLLHLDSIKSPSDIVFEKWSHSKSAYAVKGTSGLDNNHPYSEIGNCLQNLRRSVADMYQKEFYNSPASMGDANHGYTASSLRHDTSGDYRDFNGLLEKHQKRVGLLSNPSSLSSSVDQMKNNNTTDYMRGIKSHPRGVSTEIRPTESDDIHAFLQTHFKLLASFRQATNMQEMQRLYENLAYQLRQLFDDKASLMERNAELERRMTTEDAQFHGRYLEMKAEFDAKLQSARQLAEAVNEQYNANRNMERQLFDKERDLHVGMTELSSKHLACEEDLANSRLQLKQAQKTIHSLQEEVAQTRAATRGSDADLDEVKRKYKDLSRTISGKEEQLRDSQRECAELRESLQKSLVLKTELESKLKSARKSAEEASAQSSIIRGLETKLYSTERDLKERISEVDSMYEASRSELAALRPQLENAEQRIASLQEEVMLAQDARRDSEISLDDLKRKHKELLKAIATKDEQLTSLQKECVDLHSKLKRPFVVTGRSREPADKRIGHDYELMRLKEEVAAAKESERESQKLCLTMKLLKEAALNELESLKKEMAALKKQSEQTERLQSTTEHKLSAASLQVTHLEDSLEKLRSSNAALMLSNQSSEATISDLREQHFFQQQELLKTSNDLKRAMDSVEEYKRIVVEKDRLVANLKQFNQNLQSSVSSQVVDGIDLKSQFKDLETSTHRSITELQHALQLSEQEGVSKSTLIKAMTADANTNAIKFARIPVLETTIVELETTNKHLTYEKLSLIEEIKTFNSAMTALQEKVRAQAAAHKTCSEELLSARAEVNVQLQQNKMLRQEVELARLEASTTSKQLEASVAETAATARELNEARSDADSCFEDIDTIRLELLSSKNELMVIQNQFNHVNNEKTALQVQCSQAEKAQLQIIAAIQLDIESLPQVVDSKSGGNKALLSPAAATSRPSKVSSEDKVHQLLVDTAAQLKTKNRNLHKYFKARRIADKKHIDALAEWLDAMNTYAGRGLQPSLNGPMQSKLSNRHLHNNIAMSSDNAEVLAKVSSLETNLSLLAENLKAKSEEIDTLTLHLSSSKGQIDELHNRATITEARCNETQSLLIEAQHRNELLVLQEEALIRNRDRLEDDLSALDDKYRVAMMHRDELEHSLSVVEDDLTHTKQELIDARIAIDEVFLDLQTCRNELSSSQQAHAAALVEKEALENELFAAQKEKSHCHDDIKQMKDWREAREMQMAILQNNWKNMEADCKQLQQEKAEVERKVEELLSEKSSLSSMLAEVRQEKAELVIAMGNLNREKSDLGSQLNEVKVDRSELALKLHELQRDLEHRLDDSQRENAQLKRTIVELGDERTSLLGKLQGLESSEKEALSTIAEMRTQLSERDGMVSSHEERIAAMQSEAREHIAEITSLRPLVAKLKEAKEDVMNVKSVHVELQRRFDQCVIQLDRYRRSCEQLTKSQSDSDALIADLRSMLTTLGDEHNDLLTKSTHLEQQLTSYTHLDSDYQSIRLELTAKTAEVQLLKGQLDAERQSTQLLRSGLDVTTRKSQLQEEQLELTTRKLESLTDEYKKRIDEHALLKAEQATQQQQLMGALTLQLDDTRHKRDLSESSLRVLDEQLKSKTAELARQEQSVHELTKQKAQLEHQLKVSEGSSQLLLNSMKQYQMRCDAQEMSIRETSRKLEASNSQVLQLEHEVAVLQDTLASKEGAMHQLQHKCREKELDLVNKERSLEEATHSVYQLSEKLDSVSRRKDAELLSFDDYTIILDRNHDDSYQSMQNSLDAKMAEIQLLKDQLNEETRRSVQCQASLDAMTLQNKHCELQLELTTRKLESLTDEYKKRIDEHALLKAEQATQQQQLMGALTLQLDDTRHKRDLSESSLRVLDEQLKNKITELARQEQSVHELTKHKANLDHKIMLAENSNQHLETAMKQLQAKYNSQLQELQEATKTLEFFSTRVFQLEHELSKLQTELVANEATIDRFQLRVKELETDLQRKARLLDQATLASSKANPPPKIHHLESTDNLFEQLNFDEYTVILDNKHSDSVQYL